MKVRFFLIAFMTVFLTASCNLLGLFNPPGGNGTPDPDDDPPVQTSFSISGSVSISGFDGAPASGTILVLVSLSFDEEDLRDPLFEQEFVLDGSTSFPLSYSVSGIPAGSYALAAVYFSLGADTQTDLPAGISESPGELYSISSDTVINLVIEPINDGDPGDGGDGEPILYSVRADFTLDQATSLGENGEGTVYLILASSYEIDDILASEYITSLDLTGDSNGSISLDGVPPGSYAVLLAYFLPGTFPGADVAKGVYSFEPEYQIIEDGDLDLGEIEIKELFTVTGSFTFSGFGSDPDSGKIIVIVAASYEESDLRNAVAYKILELDTINPDEISNSYHFSVDYIPAGTWALMIQYYEDQEALDSEQPDGITFYNDPVFYSVGPEEVALGNFVINKLSW